MNEQKKNLLTGCGLLLGFAAVLVFMFLPLIQGKNMIDYFDNLYNTISKGSAYYIPKLKKDAVRHEGKPVSLVLKIEDDAIRRDLAQVLTVNGLTVESAPGEISLNADFGKLVGISLEDTDLMFANQGAKIAARYNLPEKNVLFVWWKGLNAVEKSLTRQKQYSEAKFVGTVVQKGVETAYNYYGISVQNIGDQVYAVVFSLVFYVVYTLWFGMGIMYLFKGIGLHI
ncbi:hypothetical protein KKI24_26855 [bacterium]|nr:hypothetical protein [bacterium]